MSGVFDRVVLSRICFFLSVANTPSFALCSKRFYEIARLVNTRHTRWNITSSEQLNELLFHPRTFMAKDF